jgi:hypothetical protein
MEVFKKALDFIETLKDDNELKETVLLTYIETNIEIMKKQEGLKYSQFIELLTDSTQKAIDALVEVRGGTNAELRTQSEDQPLPDQPTGEQAPAIRAENEQRGDLPPAS